MRMFCCAAKGKDLGSCWLTSCCFIVVLPYESCFFPMWCALADEIELLFAFLVSGTPRENPTQTGWGHSTCVNRRDAAESVPQKKVSLQEDMTSGFNNVFLSIQVLYSSQSYPEARKRIKTNYNKNKNNAFEVLFHKMILINGFSPPPGC